MEYLIIGVLLGVLICRWRPEKKAPVVTEVETPDREEERRRLIEDQKAFRQLMSYSAEVAYGGKSEES